MKAIQLLITLLSLTLFFILTGNAELPSMAETSNYIQMVFCGFGLFIVGGVSLFDLIL